MSQMFHRLHFRRSKSSSFVTKSDEETKADKSSESMNSSSQRNVVGGGGGNMNNSKSTRSIGGNTNAKSRVSHINIKLLPSKSKQRPWKKTKAPAVAESAPYHDEGDDRVCDTSFTEEESVSRNESVRTTSSGSRTKLLQVSPIPGPVTVALTTPEKPSATSPSANSLVSSSSNRTAATRSTVTSGASTSPDSHVSFASIDKSPSLTSAFSGSASSSNDSQGSAAVENHNLDQSMDSDSHEDSSRCFEVDYRGHYVVTKRQDEQHLDSVVQMALQASKKALVSSRSISAVTTSSTKGTNPTAATKKSRKDRESASERLDESGNDLFEQGKLDQAFEMYEEALQLKRLSLLGQFNALQHQKTCGASNFAPISNEERRRLLISMATSVNNLAYLRQVRGNTSAQEILECYEMALQIKREILGTEHISVAKTLSNIGSVYYLQLNFHEAAAFYEQARDILTHNLGSEHLDVCTVTSNLGDVHCSMGQWQRAVKEYRTALELRWRLLGPADPKVVRLMEQIAELEMEIDKNRNRQLSKEGKKRGAAGRSKRYHRPVLTDLRKLQRELREDLETFSALERQLPLDMIKDKASLFRELRELKGDTETDEEGRQLDILLGPESSTSTSDDSSQVSEDVDRDAEMNTPLLAEGAPMHITGDAPPTSVEMDTTRMGPLSPIDVVMTPQSLDLAPRRENQTEDETIVPGLSSHTSFTPSVLSFDTMATSAASPSTPDRPTAQVTSYPRLSPEQRRQALQTVRERLAQLRASRDDVPDFKLPSFPQQPTLASVLPSTPVQGMVHAPSSFLVKTSELLTMKQGIDALRTLPNQTALETAPASRPRKHIQQKPRPPVVASAPPKRMEDLDAPRPKQPRSTKRLSFPRCSGVIL